jgi:hypothetical protein
MLDQVVRTHSALCACGSRDLPSYSEHRRLCGALQAAALMLPSNNCTSRAGQRLGRASSRFQISCSSARPTRLHRQGCDTVHPSPEEAKVEHRSPGLLRGGVEARGARREAACALVSHADGWASLLCSCKAWPAVNLVAVYAYLGARAIALDGRALLCPAALQQRAALPQGTPTLGSTSWHCRGRPEIGRITAARGVCNWAFPHVTRGLNSSNPTPNQRPHYHST